MLDQLLAKNSFEVFDGHFHNLLAVIDGIQLLAVCAGDDDQPEATKTRALAVISGLSIAASSFANDQVWSAAQALCKAEKGDRSARKAEASHV